MTEASFRDGEINGFCREIRSDGTYIYRRMKMGKPSGS